MSRSDHALVITLLLAMLLPFTSTHGADRHEHRMAPSAEGHAHSHEDERLGLTVAVGPQPTAMLAGQYAFATIADIVAVLEADPATDWSRVDLERLRHHLIDMDRVTLGADVTQEDVPGGARFSVTSKDRRIRESIRRMIRAHAATANRASENDAVGDASWRFAFDTHPDGVMLTVTGEGSKAAARIRAYGFIGILVAGSHHPRHHLALARGESPHEH